MLKVNLRNLKVKPAFGGWGGGGGIKNKEKKGKETAILIKPKHIIYFFIQSKSIKSDSQNLSSFKK